MQTVTTCTSRQSYTISGYSESDVPPLMKESNVALLIKTLALFQEIADCLVSNGQEQSLRASYRYLHGNALLLAERIVLIQETGSSAVVNPFAGLILNRFASLLRTPVNSSFQSQHTPFSGLIELYECWDTLVSRQERVMHLRSRLYLDSKNRWDGLVTFLEECVDSLDEPSSHTVKPKIRSGKAREPPSAVYFAARTMFHALTTSSRDCTCDTRHDYAARLKLATYRKPPDIEDRYTFDLFLSSNEVYWQETLIHTTLPQKRSKVRIATQDDRPRKKRHSRRVPVYRLCDHIKPRQPLFCLNLAVEDERLWKSRSTDSQLHLGSTLISLEKIIEEHPTSLSEKIKRVLAVLLGHSILHLHGTTSLQPSYFNSSNILFFGTPALIPVRPFIHMKIEANNRSSGAVKVSDEPDEFVDPDDLPLHSHPSLVMLAIMLMEVYMAKPIFSLVSSLGVTSSPLESIDENSRYRIATEAFRKFGSEFTDNYRVAVAACLDPDIGFDSDDNEIEGDSFKSLIYNEIVQRLEDELDQGFSESISSDNLDEAAPKLNLNSWGTMTFASLYETETPKSQTFQRYLSPFSESSSQSHVFRSLLPEGQDMDNGIVGNREVPEIVQNSQSDRGNLTPSRVFTHQSYTIGWICALAEEMAVARAMLDQIHPLLPQNYKVDNNNYILGRIGSHNIVLACLPDGVAGTTSAAIVAHRMRSTFQGLRFGLMVGIGGGAPSEIDDIRLGDVVVGVPRRGGSGVIQYDFGKTVQDGRVIITSSLNRPPDALLTAVNNLRSEHLLLGPKLKLYLNNMVGQYPRLHADFSHPGAQHDVLYQSDYYHPNSSRTCTTCDRTKFVPRRPRDSTEPAIHYGLIASGNQVMKDGLTRDRLKQDLDILCFEMEAAGLVDDFPCLVIRGISDYADSHKNDIWRSYAAAAAAAYAKELLNSISTGLDPEGFPIGEL